MAAAAAAAAAAVALLSVAALLGQCKGENPSQSSPEVVVVVTAKQTATLPCVTPARFTSERNWDPNVEWSKEGPSPVIVFFYMNGCERLERKNETFVGRTNIILKELKGGNISLMISNVQLTDAGIYRCMATQKERPELLSVVKLFVVSDPILSVVPAEDDKVSLQCQVDYCSTEPDIKILDHVGKLIKAESLIKHKDSRGCGTSRIRVTLQSPTKSVTCQAHHSEINKTKETTLNIPAGCMKSCPTTTVSGFVGGLVGVLVGVVATLMGLRIWNCWLKFKMSKKSSTAFRQGAAEDNAKNNAIDQLKAGATAPAETGGANRAPVVGQRGRSVSDATQLKSTKPTGPLHDSSFNVRKTPQDTNLRQVTTANGSRPKSSTFPPKAYNGSQADRSVNKPNGQHQNTPALPLSRSPHKYHIASLSNNPFHALADLTEESQQLLE